MDNLMLKSKIISYQHQFKGFINWNNTILYKWEYELYKDLNLITETAIKSPEYFKQTYRIKKLVEEIANNRFNLKSLENNGI